MIPTIPKILSLSILVVASAFGATTDTVDFNSGALTDSFSVNVQTLPTIGVSNYSLATNGLGGTQGVDLVAGTTSDATLVYTPRSFNIATLGSLDVSCFFLKQATTAGNGALSLGLTSSSAGRLTNYDVANTLDDSHLALRLGRNATSLRFEIQSKAGNTTTVNTTNTSSNLTLTDGNWYQFRASFTRISATVIQVSGSVYNSDASGTIGSMVQSYAAVSVTLPDVAGDNQLWVALRGFGDAGADAWDNLQIVAQDPPATAPATPTNFTATVVSSFLVNLAWTDASNNEKGFVIGRSTNSGGPYVDIAATAAGATSYSDATVDGGTTYYYTVRAALPGNDSPLSTERTAITPAPALATYYVSPNGTNTAPPAGGTLAAPFQTISYAASQAKPGDTILIRAGTYRETVTPPSGTSKYPITFASYNNEPVVISGADPLNLTWTIHSGSIYKATTGLNFRQIFVNGVMMNEARWPNAKVDKILDAPRSVVGSVPEGVINLAITDPNLPAGNLTGATVHITPGNLNGEWSAFTRKTNAYDAATKTLSWATTWDPGTTNAYLTRAGNPYWIYGALPLLDIATEWHLDTAASTLYLWTPNGASPASHSVEVKSRAHAFMMDNRSYITVKDLHVFAAGISMKSATGCVVDNSHLRYIQHNTTADWNVGNIDSACAVSGTGNVWKNSSILVSSQNGIQLDGVGNTVENCVIRDVDYYPGQYYSSVKCSSGSGQTITRNTFSRSGRALILPYAPAMEISYNDISYGQMLTKDGGALYVFAFDGQGTAIHHNWVHHDQSGIYIDNNTSNFQVFRNVCYDNRHGMHFNEAGRNHKVYHNTVLRSSDKDIPNTFAGTSVATLAGTEIINTLHDGVFGELDDATLVNNGWHPPVGADFVPQAGSTAINTGTTIPGYTDGFAGAGPDIGAYESGGTYWVPGASFTIPAFPTPGSTVPPAAPTQLAVTPGDVDTSAILTWVPSNSAVSSYTVKRSSTAGGPYTTLGTVNSGYTFTDTTLSSGVAFYYVVTASNSSGESGNSNEAKRIANPTNLTVTLSSGNMVLTWIDNSPDEPGFTIERSTDGGTFAAIATLPANSTSYTDAAFYRNTYTYRISAGASSRGNPVTIAVPGHEGLVKIQAESLDAQSGLVVGTGLSYCDNNDWAQYASTDFGAGVNAVTFRVASGATSTAHYIEVWLDARTTAAGGTRIANINVLGTGDYGTYVDLSATLSGVSGVRDLYLVFKGGSGVCNMDYFTFSPSTPLTAPVVPGSFTVSTQPVLSWNLTGTNEDGVKIERSTDGVNFFEIATVAAPASSYLDAGLMSGTPVYYRVRSFNRLGISDFTTISSVVVQAPPYIFTGTGNTTYPWDAGGNWDVGVFPNIIGADVRVTTNFTANTTLSLNQSITLGSLKLGDSAATTSGGNNFNTIAIVPGTGGSLRFETGGVDALLERPDVGIAGSSYNNGVDQITANIQLDKTLEARIGNSSFTGGITLSGMISGSGGIRRTFHTTGTPTTASPNSSLRLSNPANSYSGPTTITGGRVEVNGSVVSGANSPLGNATSAIVIGNATTTAANNNSGIELALLSTDATSNHSFSRNLDFSQGTGATTWRGTFVFNSNATAPGNATNTLAFSGDLALGTRYAQINVQRRGMTLDFTGDITGGPGGTLYWNAIGAGFSTNGGAAAGIIRISNRVRNYTIGQNLTNGTLILLGSVPATATSSPIGTQTIGLADGNGGNIASANGQHGIRSLFLDNDGTTYARTLTIGGGINSSTYNGGTFNVYNGYQLGGVNTSGKVTFSGAINSTNPNVGANTSNQTITLGQNLALLAATGGTAEFSGVIGDTTATTNTTRVTINQFRNHPQLDTNANGVPDSGGAAGSNANDAIGTPTTGTVILAAANTHAGGTEVLGGTLLANNSTGSATGSGAVNVQSGAKLGGTGTISGAVTIASNGGLAFTLNTAPGAHDKLDLGSTLTFSGSSTLTIAAANNSPATGTYTLLTAASGTGSGTLPTLSLPAGWAATLQRSGNDLQLEVSATAVPAAPASLAATPGNAVANLTWTPSATATSYTVKRGTAAGGPYTDVTTTVTGTSYQDTDLTNGTTYFYVVTAVNAGGASNLSNEVTATPQIPAPAAPASLTASPGNALINLTWSPSSTATSYTVKRGSTSGGPFTDVTTTVTGTSYQDTGLINGTTYHYVVSAINDGGGSPDSPQASTTTWTAQQSWRQTYFGTIENTGNAADSEDPDGDGLINFLEYALDLDPLASSPAATTGALDPNGKLTLTFKRARPELIYQVWGSGDFVDWAKVGAENPGEVDENVTVTDEPPLDATKRFMRLKVSIP